MKKRIIALATAPLLAMVLLVLTLGASTPVAVGEVNAAISLGSTYTQTFDSLANTGISNPWTNDSTLSGWYSNRTVYIGDAGTSNTGGLHSYGITSTVERALGSVGSGSANPVLYGVRLRNDTGLQVTNLVITFTGEQWRSGTQQNALEFAYQTGAVVTDVTTGTWITVGTLGYTGLVTATTAGPLDGNANATPVSGVITVTVLPDQEIMLRWRDVDDSGSDQGLAIDDLLITAITASQEADLSVLKSGPATANAGNAITYTISLSNTGTATATLSVLTDTLPAEISFVTYTTASAVTFTQPSATELVWELGDILTTTPAISIQVQGMITTNITNGTVVTNTAVAATASSESSTANNTAQVATIVSSTVLPDVEVYVQKTAPAAVVFGGELFSYTIVYGNEGTQTVEATLTDTLPISFTTSNIAFDNSGLNPIDDTNTRSWTATLASGDRFTFTLALTVPTSIVNGTLITNTIEITATGSGNNPLNDLASASGTVYQIVPIGTARAGTNGQVFAVEGQVIFAPSTFGTSEWGVQDASGGISVFYSPAPVVALGDRVRLVATRDAFNNQEQLAAPVYYFANLGSAPQVQPLPYTTGQVASGATEGWLSVITGTVSGLPACTGNYQFNINDGSGSTVVFVDQDTAVNVCALGVVNGDRIVVTGFSTQFGAVYEVKPRFPADVKRLFDVTFVYHDLEDAVQSGEDVQLRGDFTNWGTTPITMAHDAGYTVFSATVTLPTTTTQNYRYYVEAAGGNTAQNLLNTNDRSLVITQGTTLKNDYRNVVVDGGNLNGPAAQTINLGGPTASIDGQLYVPEVTNPAGAGRGLKAEVGYGNSTSPASWSWFAMVFASQTGNNDVYAGVITPTAGGVYSYATRYNGNWGAGNPNSLWVYADLDGIPFSLDKTGVLTVTAPQLTINKAVAAAHPVVNLGEIVTYTFTLSNSGNGAATGMLITDVLPTAVNFGGFVQQNSATFGSGAITWSGSLNAGTAATVIFTTTVKNDQSLYDTDVMNTVQYTSGNGGSGSANIAFAVVKRYFIYMPLIQR